jgi:hypothetical protein
MESALSSGPCDCATRCPGAFDCTCIEVIGPPRKCNCTCPGGVAIEPEILKRDEPVNLNVRDAEVGAVAEFLHRATSADILVPVGSMRKRITTKLEGIAFADALDELGLVLRAPRDADY